MFPVKTRTFGGEGQGWGLFNATVSDAKKERDYSLS